MIICIYDVAKYGSCMIDDSLFEMIYYLSFWNDILKLLSFPQKRIVLTIRSRVLSFRVWVSTISESDFLCPSFWNDIWLSFRNEQSVPIYILKCFMTVILKWGVENFRTQNYFGQENTKYFNDENTTFLYFSYTDFYARLGPYPCV